MEKIKVQVDKVQETIDLLLNNNEQNVCDSAHERFNDHEKLPPFYDEEKFKRGQQFFRKHIFAMLIGKLLGLITVISTPTILSVLIFTKMSGDALSAYKRYMGTILHMCIWYRDDFKPGSNLWKSIATVKGLHHSASKRSCAFGKGSVLQKDMGITQFGFMGYIVTCPELIGIHKTSNDELEGFIHLWRVIGYIMGVEDKYNICKESLEETKAICQALMENLFVPNLRKQDPDFVKMSDALITGMWVMQPMLETKSFMTYLYDVLEQSTNNNNERKLPHIELNTSERILLAILKGFIYYMKYTLVRWYANAKMWVSFWLMRNFPFLAYYKFGYKDSHVAISLKVTK